LGAFDVSELPPAGLWRVEAELVPLVGGHRNRVFRTRGLARDLVFKTTRREPAAIEWLVPVFGIAEQSGFAVPWPVRSANGRYVENGWMCELFLGGKAIGQVESAGLHLLLPGFQAATRDLRQRPGFLSARELCERDVGGDVDLRDMPAWLVALCRAAWLRVAGHEMCVVHGDLNGGNLIRMEDGRVGVVDWDESRVDAGVFDRHGCYPGGCDEAVEMAVLAWEVACCWGLEPDYAREMAARLARVGRRG